MLESLEAVDGKGRIAAAEPLVFPLSFGEQRLWFLNQLEPGNSAYNVPEAMRLMGPLQVECLERAIGEIVRRHESLRTTFALVNGQPMQIVAPTVPTRLDISDLSRLPEPERERVAAAEVAEQANLPFDLQRGPLLRSTLFVLGAEEHILLLVMHHIISEGGWSMSIFLRELGILYNAYSSGLTSPLPELPLQYGDYAVWQRDTLQGGVLQPHLSYWKAQLEGAPPVVEWPADRPRPAEQSYRGARQSIFLPKHLKDALNSLSRREGVTLFMTLLAAFQTLLFRFTGQDDLPVGVPVAGRTPQTTDLIGLFLNTIVLRPRLSAELPFRQLMRQMRQLVFDGLAHQDMPFEVLVEALRPDRSLAFTPLFQVMFAFQNAPRSELELADLKITPFEFEIRSSMVDLTFFAWELPDGLRVVFEYSTDLFDPATMARMLAHFRVLLEGIVRNPDQQLSNLPLLTEAEQNQILQQWNDTRVEFPSACVHQLFEQQAARCPDAIALAFADQQLSYAELNRRAAHLAHHLRQCGVGPEVLVGLMVERSAEMVVALLGILKAGGAYVPLDPSFPPERLAYMVEDSQIRVLLTHKGLEQMLPVRPPLVIQLDSDWPTNAEHEGEPPELPGSNRDRLAYVLYTSGSTGRPKGVEIPHSALTNFLLSMQREPGFTATDTLLAVTTLSFDIAGLEFYLPLISGGTIAIASRDDAIDPVRLMERMRDTGCTVMQATPPTWRALIDAGWSGSANLKVFCCGEALVPDLARQLRRRCAELWNGYGPTETTIYSTIHKVATDDDPVPIGRPIANTQVLVLDANRSPVPAGAVGELYIGGAGLARGYLRRGELTKERFIPNPFTPHARLYRTGDLARWRADGTLECLGRVDHQVKIRGFRIECGEVEAVLGSHPAIRQCAVIARQTEPGDKQLVAYFEARISATPAVADLRAHLEKFLPAYMVPRFFVAMEKLPLTANGKIDRKSLPAPVERLTGRDEFAAPRDSIEQLLAGIWARVLQLERVGVHDNFFDLGGHSLLAVRVVVEIDRLCKTRLPLATLLRAPTIAELAAVLRKQQWAPSWSSLVPLRPGGSRAPLFLMHSHGGNVLEYHPLVNCLEPDQPVYALQSRGLDGNIVTNLTLQEMAAAYISELRSLQPKGPYFLGGFCMGGILALEAAQQLTDAGQEVALLVMIQSTHPDALGFHSRTTLFQRCWNRAIKRLDLEAENLANRGQAYILERCCYFWSRACARAAIAFDKMTGRHPSHRSTLSTAYILEAVAMQNGKALENYVPRPYEGDVLLFRAGKQLSGQLVDEYLGWKRVLHGAVEVCEVPGHQQNLLLEPNVLRLGRELASRLNAACRRREEPAVMPPAA